MIRNKILTVTRMLLHTFIDLLFKLTILIGLQRPVILHQAERRRRSVPGTNPVAMTPRSFFSSKPAARTS